MSFFKIVKCALSLVLLLALCDIKAVSGADKVGHDTRVIIIGVDGMDPRLSERMMDAGRLPNLDKLRKAGGFKPLGTSNPPQSPVAWSNFINGAGPGTHGIFDFIHRHPENQIDPYYSAADTVEGEGAWEVGDHKLPLTFWPFNHKPTETLLKREGIPFWDYLDAAGIKSNFYDLPANYPPSKSEHGHHCCLSGMGVPDVLGTYGTYQHWSEEGPVKTVDDGGGMRTMVWFETGDTAVVSIQGPDNGMLINPEPTEIKMALFRDIKSDSCAIKLPSKKILLKKGDWSDWVHLDFEMEMPSFLPNEHLAGVVRFYLQEVSPNFRLYMTPVNFDPADAGIQITEPPEFLAEIASELGTFYTSGFQEDYSVLKNNLFNEDEYIQQAMFVLDERLEMLEYAVDHYEDGLLFFYFSSVDLQGHMLWWDSDEKHPTRTPEKAKEYFEHLKTVYEKMDKVVGKIIKRYGDSATVMVMSDHGFCNFKRQININNWLRKEGYLQPETIDSIMSPDVAWDKSVAYGLGLNGLYLNLKGREKYGVVTAADKEKLILELIAKLKNLKDTDGTPVIRNVYRSSEVYKGAYTKNAPDLLLGFYRGYRASWSATLGNMDETVFSDNDSQWSADHCIDPLEVPGVLFCNKPIVADAPSLIDMAPTVLSQFNVKIPEHMTGKRFLE